MGLTDRLNAWLAPPPKQRAWWDLALGGESFNFNGHTYPLGLNTTMPGEKVEAIESSFVGYVQQGYKANGVVFACMAARMLFFAQARFQFQKLVAGRPDDLFGTPALSLFEQPWPNAAPGDLLNRAITDADLAGNFYATLRNGWIRRMRPDWVDILLGSYDDPDLDSDDLDADFLGVVFYPGGKYSGKAPVYLNRGAICHFAPIPDPLAHYRGMSWLTPIVREIMGDQAATTHKLAFFSNGATPNLVVKRGGPSPSKESFDQWWQMIEAGHKGAANAYKTMYLTGGDDATVVGKDLQQLDFKMVQGAGETRIAAAARIHPAIVGLSEGLQGASLNAGNFAAARRLVADGFLHPYWANFAGSMQTLVPPPPGSRLWYDPRDVPFLREDRKDAAEIQSIKAQTIRTLTDGGYEPASVIRATEAEDMSLLVWTGLVSVQLQPPGTTEPEPVSTNGKTTMPPEPARRT
jgi:phage portal protein BeeE